MGQCRKGCCPCREICSDETACPVLHNSFWKYGIHQIQYPARTGMLLKAMETVMMRSACWCAAQAGPKWWQVARTKIPWSSRKNSPANSRSPEWWKMVEAVEVQLKRSKGLLTSLADVFMNHCEGMLPVGCIEWESSSKGLGVGVQCCRFKGASSWSIRLRQTDSDSGVKQLVSSFFL